MGSIRRNYSRGVAKVKAVERSATW